MTKIERDHGQSLQTAYEYTYTGDGIRHMKMDHLANKEYRYGCSIDCGGMPLRVYSRDLGSQGEWNSVEDYLQVGTALGYDQNWQFEHSGGELLMMGASGEPREYYPHDSNGLNVQSEPSAPCVCVVQPQTPALCPPLGYGGCEGGRCGEAPSVLTPFSPFVPSPTSEPPFLEDFVRPQQVLAPVVSHLALCSAAARRAALNAMEMCKRGLRPFHCDKLGHCVGACVASRCAGPAVAWCLGWVKELGRLDPKDLEANHQGEQCARTKESCASCCLKWWIGRWYVR